MFVKPSVKLVNSTKILFSRASLAQIPTILHNNWSFYSELVGHPVVVFMRLLYSWVAQNEWARVSERDSSESDKAT